MPSSRSSARRPHCSMASVRPVLVERTGAKETSAALAFRASFFGAACLTRLLLLLSAAAAHLRGVAAVESTHVRSPLAWPPPDTDELRAPSFGERDTSQTFPLASSRSHISAGLVRGLDAARSFRRRLGCAKARPSATAGSSLGNGSTGRDSDTAAQTARIVPGETAVQGDSAQPILPGKNYAR